MMKKTQNLSSKLLFISMAILYSVCSSSRSTKKIPLIRSHKVIDGKPIKSIKFEDIEIGKNDTYALIYNMTVPLGKVHKTFGEITGTLGIDHSAIAVVLQPSNKAFVIELDGADGGFDVIRTSLAPQFDADKSIVPTIRADRKVHINLVPGMSYNYYAKETYVGMATLNQVKEYFTWAQNLLPKPAIYNWFTLQNKDTKEIYQDTNDCQGFSNQSMNFMIQKQFSVNFILHPERNYLSWNLLDEPTEIKWTDMSDEQKEDCENFYKTLYGEDGFFTKIYSDIAKIQKDVKTQTITEDVIEIEQMIADPKSFFQGKGDFHVWSTVPEKGDGYFKYGRVNNKYQFLTLTKEKVRKLGNPNKPGFQLMIPDNRRSRRNGGKRY